MSVLLSLIASRAYAIFWALNKVSIYNQLSFMFNVIFTAADAILENILFHLHKLPPPKRKSFHIVLRTLFKVLFRLCDFKGLDYVTSSDIESTFQSLGSPSLQIWPNNLNLLWNEEEFIRSLLLQYTENTPPSPSPLVDQRTQSAWVRVLFYSCSFYIVRYLQEQEN